MHDFLARHPGRHHGADIGCDCADLVECARTAENGHLNVEQDDADFARMGFEDFEGFISVHRRENSETVAGQKVIEDGADSGFIVGEENSPLAICDRCSVIAVHGGKYIYLFHEING